MQNVKTCMILYLKCIFDLLCEIARNVLVEILKISLVPTSNFNSNVNILSEIIIIISLYAEKIIISEIQFFII